MQIHRFPLVFVLSGRIFQTTNSEEMWFEDHRRAIDTVLIIQHVCSQ